MQQHWEGSAPTPLARPPPQFHCSETHTHSRQVSASHHRRLRQHAETHTPRGAVSTGRCNIRKLADNPSSKCTFLPSSTYFNVRSWNQQLPTDAHCFCSVWICFGAHLWRRGLLQPETNGRHWSEFAAFGSPSSPTARYVQRVPFWKQNEACFIINLARINSSGAVWTVWGDGLRPSTESGTHWVTVTDVIGRRLVGSQQGLIGQRTESDCKPCKQSWQQRTHTHTHTGHHLFSKKKRRGGVNEACQVEPCGALSVLFCCASIQKTDQCWFYLCWTLELHFVNVALFSLFFSLSHIFTLL